MEAERLILEIAARDLSGDALQAVVRSVGEIRKAAIDSSRAFGEMGNKGGAEIDKIGNALGSIAKMGAGVFAGIKLNDLVNDLADFHVQTMANVGGLGSLADRFGITTDQLQAYQAAARVANVTSEELSKTLGTFNLNLGKASAGSKEQIDAFEKLGVKILDQHGKLRPMPDLLNEVARALLNVENSSQRTAIASALVGEKGARLTPLLRELALPIADLVDRGKAFGEIVDREVIDKLDRSKNASEAAKQQFTALYATLAAPLHAQGLEYVATLTGDLTKRLREAKAESGGLLAQMDRLFGGRGVNPMGQNPAQRNEGELAELRAKLAARETDGRRRDNPARHQQVIDKDIADLKAQIADRERLTQTLPQILFEADEEAARRGGAIPAGLTQFGGAATAGSSNTKAKGGSEKRDRIGEAIAQLRGEAEAARSALDTLRGDATTPLDQLEREVALRKRIADEIAKLGKYDPKDPRVAQIGDLVREHEKLESSLQRRKKAMQDADEIERRVGDGTVYLRTEQQRLNEAFDTGRLTHEAYAAQMRLASDQADLMRLKLLGQEEGWRGVLAGMQYAAKQQSINNTAFLQGQRLQEATIESLTQAFTKWRKTGQFDMREFLSSWTDMLAQMAMRAAATQVFDSLFGSLLGGASSGAGAAAASTAPGLLDGLFTSTMGSPFMFAEGGRPPLDRTSIIGERGPEFFVPDTAGRVVPMGDLGGGGPQIVINMTNQVGKVVSHAELEQFGVMVEERAKRGAIAGVADAKSRGGSYRQTMRR